MRRRKWCYLNVIRNIRRNGFFLPVFLGLCLLSIILLHNDCVNNLPADLGKVDGSYQMLIGSSENNTSSGIPLELKRYGLSREFRISHQDIGPYNHKNDTKNYPTVDPHIAARALVCRNASLGANNTAKTAPIRVRWSLRNDVMFCPIYKVGSTFWRRIFMIQREPRLRHLRNPFEISFETQYQSSVYGINDAYKRANSLKFLFTRNPYSRLYSAYVDKILAPNPVFWKEIGEKAIRLTRPNISKNSRICGHDVTFPEFIKHVIHSLETNVNVDPHFVPMETNCKPCKIKYDFIGKIEAFAKDSTFILQKLNLNKTIQLMEAEGKELVADDAIRDTIKQAFTGRRKIIRCMSFYDALNRAWTKLKLRGLIGDDKLTLDRVKDAGVTFRRMVELAHASRAKSNEHERRRMKEKGYLEYWSQISLPDKIRLRSLYAKDFVLFGYNDTPAELFVLPQR